MMQPLSSDREEKDGGVTRFDWDCIISVQAQERNQKEFTIFAVPLNKKKQSIQINKANAQQHIFLCKERNRLITELTHKLHIFNGDKPHLVERALYQPEFYIDSSKKPAMLRLYPTVIQLLVKPPKGRNIGNQESVIQQDMFVRNNQEESKRIQEESKLEFSDADVQNQDLLFEEIDDEDDEMEGYESDNQAIMGGAILTPYKGSLLGGRGLGESGIQDLNENQLAKPTNLSHYIYLCDIDKLLTSGNTLMIVKKNQDIERFTFKTEDKMKDFVNQIKKNYKEAYKTVLISQIFASFEIDKLAEDINFLRKDSQQICYKLDAQVAYKLEHQMMNVSVELDENCLYLLDRNTQNLMKKYYIKDLEMVITNDKSKLFNLALVFQKEFDLSLNIQTPQQREKLVSVLLTLRNFLIPQGVVDKLIILINSTIDFSLRIHGLDPLESQQFQQDYEGMVFRKITESINFKDNTKTFNMIEEALLNATFYNLVKLDQRSIKTIIKEIDQTIENYLHLEYCESALVDEMLKRIGDHFIIDFYSYKKKTTQSIQVQQVNQSEFLSQQQNIYTEEGAEKLKSYEQLLEKVVKYLNLLGYLLNSKTVLTEIAESEEIMVSLIRLLISKNPYLALLASQVIKQSIDHYSINEYKAELANKKLLIKGGQTGGPSTAQNQGAEPSKMETQNQTQFLINDSWEPMLYVQAFKEYMNYLDYLYENSEVVKTLHFFCHGNILRSFLQTKKYSTRKEDLKAFADMIMEDDPRYLQVLQDEKAQSKTQGSDLRKQEPPTSVKREDPLRNKPMFHLVDKFSLLDYDHLDIHYIFTLILNETLSYFKKNEMDKLKDLQQYIITYSVQFVRQLDLQMESQVQEQRKTSVQTLSKILFQNSDCIKLLLRCFPKTLIDKVETHIDLLQSLSWQDQEWEEFFLKITYKNFDTATEQWNEETRKELKKKLQNELQKFIESKKLQKEVMADENRKELVLPNHEFNRNHRVISRSVNLKWNYMEFQVKYESLNNKYLVWQYYLTKLLQESNLQETQRPYFTQVIKKPALFWQELKIKFMSSFEKEEQIMILKSMCVLYNTHFKELKDLKSIPYLLKLFEQKQYQHCHFILTQLIHVALSIDKEYAIKNMKKFIKADGLEVLFRQMKIVFKELNRPDKNRQSVQYLNYGSMKSYSRDHLEKALVQEGVGLINQANFTNSNTNSRYFKRNSKYVCTGILSLKILDLIFKEMYELDYVPLPTNRQYLLQPQSLATLSQMLMIENVDLTRELTIFILSHMNNHYSFQKLKNTGMIEFLILCLSTRNGDRALEILQKFQEVWFDTKGQQQQVGKNQERQGKGQHENQLKMGQLNVNDLKMIQDDKEKMQKSMSLQNNDEIELKNHPILGESIFLRFLPVPLIKFLYEEGQEKFIEIYKMQSYESPILIWNADLRQILEDHIRKHAQEFIDRLKEFANKKKHELKQSKDMPIYDKRFDDIIKYPTIENEVRCGRYYLRVWVNQNYKSPDSDFFDIPAEEEDQFHKNLQHELRHCINEEQNKDQQKIIILFRACLLSLQRFQQKRVFNNSENNEYVMMIKNKERSQIYLEEVKKILMETCRKRDLIYDDTAKQIIYIGIKIIYEVIKNNQQYDKGAIINEYAIKDVLSKKGVENISEIFNLILKNSFGNPNLSVSQSINEEVLGDNQDSVAGLLPDDQLLNTEHHKISVDRIETKTLSLCVKAFNIMLSTDIQAFADLPLSQRVNIFRQISRLLDLCFSLLPIFKDKVLLTAAQMMESRTYSSYQNQAVPSPRGKSKKKLKNKNRKSGKSKSRKQGTKKHLYLNNPQQSQPQISLTNQNHSLQNNQLGQILSKPLQELQLQDMDKFNFNKRRDEMFDRHRVHKKDPNIDYKTRNLLQIISDQMDKHSIELIFDLTRSIFELTREITKNPVLHPELISSGMAWKTLKYIYFQLKEETSQFIDLKYSLRESATTLKNLISFAHELENYGAESFSFKNLTKETEKEIMKNFWKCIKRIFCTKIQETLLSQFVITNNELVFSNFDPRRFFNQFSVKEEESPELVWNNETRMELFNVLEEQIKCLKKSFYEKIFEFEYSVNKRELKVEDIFVRHFNNQNEFRPENIDLFSQKIIEKLKEFIEGKYLSDLSEKDYNNSLELLKAFKNLLINENLTIDDQNKFDDYLSTFCNLIQIKPDEQGNLNANELEQDMIKKGSQLVYEIISHISKSSGYMFTYLKDHSDFIKLLIRSLYSKEKDIVDSQQVIGILQNMLNNKELKEIEISSFLIETGLIMFILYQIFEKKPHHQNYKERIELVKLILQANQHTSAIYNKYIPSFFFVEIQQKQLYDSDMEKIIEFLKELDKPDFENVFIIWNSDLKRESTQRIKNNCEMIVKSYEDSNYRTDLDLKEFVNPKLENEIIVSDVIIRIYNKNPAVFINIKLNTFILSLSSEIQQIAQELFKMGQQYKDEFAYYDDAHPIDDIPSTPQQKKFKTLCNRSLMLLTSLLLSIEQLLLNDYNPNRLVTNKKEDKNAETKFYKQIIEKITDQTQLDHKVYQILGFWLQTQVFLNHYIPVEIRITFLQIIFLIIDMSDAVKVLKDNQSLMQFIIDSISSIQSDKFQKNIEEAFILLITQKMLRKDSEPIPILITNSLQKLLKIYDKKKHKKLIEFILALMATDQQYKQSVVGFIKQNEQQIKMDLKILEGRQENSEHNEAIMRIWRGKPASASDAKQYYDIGECHLIEDKLNETNIPKMKLPLLSKKSAQHYTKEELFVDNEKQREFLIPLQGGVKKPTQVLQADNCRLSNDLGFMKDDKLGYKPILDENLIGGQDLEAIEMQEESFLDEDDI